MAWASLYDGQRIVGFTDGYIDRSRVQPGTPDQSVEQRMANHFYRLIRYDWKGRARERSPEMLQLAIIGDDHWTSTMPEPFRQLAPEETDPNYRAALVIHDLNREAPFNGNWTGWIFSIGFHRVRKRSKLSQFRVLASSQLLDPIIDGLQKHDQSITDYLESLHVPYAAATGTAPSSSKQQP